MKKHDPKKHPRYPKGTIIDGINVGGKFMPKEGRGNASIGKNRLVRTISSRLEKAGKASSKEANRRIMSAVAKELKAYRKQGGSNDLKELRRVAQKAVAKEVRAIVDRGRSTSSSPKTRRKKTKKESQRKEKSMQVNDLDKVQRLLLSLDPEARKIANEIVQIYEKALRQSPKKKSKAEDGEKAKMPPKNFEKFVEEAKAIYKGYKKEIEKASPVHVMYTKDFVKRIQQNYPGLTEEEAKESVQKFKKAGKIFAVKEREEELIQWVE